MLNRNVGWLDYPPVNVYIDVENPPLGGNPMGFPQGGGGEVPVPAEEPHDGAFTMKEWC